MQGYHIPSGANAAAGGAMRIEFYGLVFDAPYVTLHLWSPWRSAELEHRLFNAVRGLPRVVTESAPDEWRLRVSDPKTWRAALQAVARVLKGWQEEADPGSERRTWRWLLEGDTDSDGYDHTGEPVSLWGFIRISLERGGLDEPDKGEDIDLQGFGVRIPGEASPAEGRGA
jgi:hypothetical protein